MAHVHAASSRRREVPSKKTGGKYPSAWIALDLDSGLAAFCERQFMLSIDRIPTATLQTSADRRPACSNRPRNR